MLRTEKQKESARKASATHRDKLRDAGLPTGTQITHQISVAFVKLLAAGHKLERSDIGLIVGTACQLAGWDATDKRLAAVIMRRINTMRRTPRVMAHHSDQMGQE